MKKNGYSLVELMVVVGIIATLSSIAIPTYIKHQAKVRRVECTSMLSNLSVKQSAYLSENSFTFNSILCPRNDNGLHVIQVGGNRKNVITLNKLNESLYCDTVTSQINGETYPKKLTSPATVSYQYTFLAGVWNSCGSSFNGDCKQPSGNVSAGDSIPLFSGSNIKNSNNYNHPTANISNTGLSTKLTNAGLSFPAGTDYERFVVLCQGNIDADGTVDLIALDNVGKTGVLTDDVKN